ncbi:hypothetical protein BGZ83_007631 [Gryganskiella cystojenkinii]|nr:hypothetical protein BGZ83_007631 [Gryganskiella cystojenkinii]
MSPQETSSGDNATPPTSSSSSMAKFYTPMNPTFIPSGPPSQSQVSLPEPPATTTSSTMSPAALAQLAAIPGLLSDSAIQAARQEYAATNKAPQVQDQFPGAQFQGLPHQQQLQQQPTSFHNTGASIGDLLRQLRETEATAYSSSSSSPSIAPHQSIPLYSSQTPSCSIPEDYSNGKVTPQLLKRLADLAEKDSKEGGGVLLSEVKRLKERQLHIEQSLFQERTNVLAKHKQQLVKLQASEIMGVDVSKQMRQTRTAHREELVRFDQDVVLAMDREIARVQETLTQFGVPMMTRSQDPTLIASQIRVLRLLEDMV